MKSVFRPSSCPSFPPLTLPLSFISLTISIVRRAPSRIPIATPSHHRVQEGDPVSFHCHSDRFPIVWTRADGGPLPYDSYYESKRLVIQVCLTECAWVQLTVHGLSFSQGASLSTEGHYLCYTVDDEGWPVKSNTVTLEIISMFLLTIAYSFRCFIYVQCSYSNQSPLNYPFLQITSRSQSVSNREFGMENQETNINSSASSLAIPFLR